LPQLIGIATGKRAIIGSNNLRLLAIPIKVENSDFLKHNNANILGNERSTLSKQNYFVMEKLFKNTQNAFEFGVKQLPTKSS